MSSPGEIVLTRAPLPVVAGFRWSVGEMMERFLKALGERRILGVRCPQCGYVYVPPRWRCGRCHAPLGEENIAELSGKGTLLSYTTASVEIDGAGNFRELSSPKALGAIKLEGAGSTIFMPLGEVKPKDLKVGMAVEVVWREETKGEPADIKYFKPVTG
jgi:hypothetical protein